MSSVLLLFAEIAERSMNAHRSKSKEKPCTLKPNPNPQLF